MKRGKRLAGWLLTLALCLGVFLPFQARAADLYFTSLNDNLLPLTASSMPMWSEGVLYVPYTVFDSGVTGIDLGVYCRFSRSHNMVTLIGLKEDEPVALLFDLNRNIAQDDITKEQLSGRAIVRNGKPYLPVDTVCSFFGFSYSYNPLPSVADGYLVRIKDESVVLTDSRFIDAAKNLIDRRLREYNQSIAPPPVPPVPPAPPVNPTPQPPAPPVNPSKPPVPVPAPAVASYLAFSCREGNSLDPILTALDRSGSRALFLLTPEVIRSQGQLIHRMVGSGHSIGLLAEGASWRESQAILEEGQALLEQLVYTRAAVASVPEAQKSSAEYSGWICWNSSHELAPGGMDAGRFADRTLARLEGRTRPVYLEMDADADAARVLPLLLARLEQENFRLHLPLETRL